MGVRVPPFAPPRITAHLPAQGTQSTCKARWKHLGPLERRLHVAVPLQQIEGEIDKRLARLAKTVKMPGFRPGKVPLKMVAQQYGPQVRSDVISDAVQTSFNDAVREQNLRVAGYPRIEPEERRGGRRPARSSSRPCSRSIRT